MTLKRPRLSLIGSNNSEENEVPSSAEGYAIPNINVNALAADEIQSSPLFSPPA